MAAVVEQIKLRADQLAVGIGQGDDRDAGIVCAEGHDGKGKGQVEQMPKRRCGCAAVAEHSNGLVGIVADNAEEIAFALVAEGEHPFINAFANHFDGIVQTLIVLPAVGGSPVVVQKGLGSGNHVVHGFPRMSVVRKLKFVIAPVDLADEIKGFLDGQTNFICSMLCSFYSSAAGRGIDFFNALILQAFGGKLCLLVSEFCQAIQLIVGVSVTNKYDLYRKGRSFQLLYV